MERILRDKDKKAYQPRIHSDRIQELFLIGKETGLPMTVLVDYAINSYVQEYRRKQAVEEKLKDAVAFADEISDKFDDMMDDDQGLGRYLEPYQNDPFGDEDF